MTLELNLRLLPKSVFIFGCGYVGSALAEALIASGIRVGALTRNSCRVADLRALGVSEVVQGNLHEVEWLSRISGRYDGVVNTVSSAGGGIDGYRLSYLEGQKRIFEWIRQVQANPVYVYTSSTSVYPQDGGVWVDEKAPTFGAPPSGKVLLEAESVVSRSTEWVAKWYVLRLAGIYGPQRHYLLDQLANGAGLIPGRGDYTLNMIHRDDVVGAILRSLACSAESGIYNICDNAPESKEGVLGYLANKLQMPVPRFDPSNISPRLRRRGGRMPDRRISNRKARAELEWYPKFPSFREGYVNLLKTFRA